MSYLLECCGDETYRQTVYILFMTSCKIYCADVELCYARHIEKRLLFGIRFIHSLFV